MTDKELIERYNRYKDTRVSFKLYGEDYFEPTLEELLRLSRIIFDVREKCK